MRNGSRLPWTAKDVFKLSARDWLIFNASIGVARVTGTWRYPIAASSDLETMTRRDVIYWLYKAQFPVARAWRDSGLESFFAQHASFRWTLPSGFRPVRELRLSAVGDLMDHPFLPNSAGCLYEDVADEIFAADVSMANLECVVFPQATGAFTIRPTAPPPLYYGAEQFDAVKGFERRNFSFMATACNHSLDGGEEGVQSTIRALRDEGISFHGVNQSEEDVRSAAVLETSGFRIGVISHTFGLNARQPPRHKPWVVNRTNLNGEVGNVDFSAIERQIQFCREKSVDAVVAQLHWGWEHEYYPRPRQLTVARHLAELGCDVVIGHHPHVVQPMECYRTARDPDRVVPIYYSLGNLVNPFSHPAFRQGALARITLVRGLAQDGETRTFVKYADKIPVFQEIDEMNKRIRLVHASD